MKSQHFALDYTLFLLSFVAMFKFEKLNVWERAIEYADLIYNVSREFPPDERFGLTRQLRRAAVSVSSP